MKYAGTNTIIGLEDGYYFEYESDTIWLSVVEGRRETIYYIWKRMKCEYDEEEQAKPRNLDNRIHEKRSLYKLTDEEFLGYVAYIL